VGWWYDPNDLRNRHPELTGQRIVHLREGPLQPTVHIRGSREETPKASYDLLYTFTPPVTGGETLGVGPNHQDWVKLPIPDATAAIGRYIQGRLTKTVFSVERGGSQLIGLRPYPIVNLFTLVCGILFYTRCKGSNVKYHKGPTRRDFITVFAHS